MTFFEFEDPWFFLLLPVIAVLAWWLGRTGPDAAVRFSSIGLVGAVARARRSRPGRWLFALRLLALAAIVAALARPRLGHTNDTADVEGIDILVTLDLSGSMRALDLSTREDVVTRLDAAKRVVRDFIDRREYDRIGLVAFAETAFIVSPLTLNHDWLKRNIRRLELGEIDGSGTAIGTAIAAATRRLEQYPSRSRILILLTDGENNAGNVSPLGAAEAAKTMGVKIYTIATGRKGRVPVPEMGANNRVLRDSSGDPVYRGRTSVSDYNEEELRRIADMTGGRFYRATESGDLERIYEAIDKLETTEVELRSYATYDELFVWPAGLGLALLFLEQILVNTRYRRLP